MLVLCDLYGNVMGSCGIAAADQPEAIAKEIKTGMDRLLHSSGVSKKTVLGIGLAISGFIDPEQGVCILSNELRWYDVPIVEIVNRICGISTYIENDANAVASGEKIFGHARKAENFTIVTLNRTIGAGHYIHGNLYRGQNGGAGEIGHCTMVPNGQPCRCGKMGCLDTIAGSKAILDAAHECQLVAESVLALEALAVSGNMAAIDILRRAGQALGLAVANVIQITNPEIVLFAFSEDIGNGILLTTVRQAIENNIFPRFLPKTHLLFHHMDENFRARGAASIAAHEFFRVQTSA
jgi:predicted NBD/HSP70 family sugar kinase